MTNYEKWVHDKFLSRKTIKEKLTAICETLHCYECPFYHFDGYCKEDNKKIAEWLENDIEKENV